MPLHNDRPTSSTAVSRQGTVSAIPASLLSIASHIKDAEKQKICTATIEWGWKGYLAISDRGTILPLADAIQRSKHIFNAALKTYIARISRLPLEHRHCVQDAIVKSGTRVAFRKLKNIDFEGFTFVHFQTIFLALISHKDVWEGGPFKDEIEVIVEFCSRIADLLRD